MILFALQANIVLFLRAAIAIWNVGVLTSPRRFLIGCPERGVFPRRRGRGTMKKRSHEMEAMKATNCVAKTCAVCPDLHGWPGSWGQQMQESAGRGHEANARSSTPTLVFLTSREETQTMVREKLGPKPRPPYPG